MGCVRCLCMRCGVWGMADYCEKGEAAERGELLQACQETAIALGTSIEESYGEGTEAVRQLEEYCELVYRAAEHRGCSQCYPENTITAFEKAMYIPGLSGVELDTVSGKADRRKDGYTAAVGYGCDGCIYK